MESAALLTRTATRDTVAHPERASGLVAEGDNGGEPVTARVSRACADDDGTLDGCPDRRRDRARYGGPAAGEQRP